MKNYLFTSESVTEGHPDKLCDMISDAVLDRYLAADPYSRVACETFAYFDGIHIAGEISSRATVDIDAVVRDVIRRIGYTREECGFDSENCRITLSVSEQSPDISMGVDKSGDTASTGAGDQGMMFGFACNETPEFMPMPIALAHKLALRLTRARKEGVVPYLLPDGKTQVTIRYENGRPKEADTIVVSTQHKKGIARERLLDDVYREIIRQVIPAGMITKNTKFFINPTGRFVIGGPKGDVGLTGRKIIVDTYGGAAAHGGGAFSGKDPTKVDRSAAYMARYAAKNVVAAGLADKCQIQLSYAIGISKPVSVLVDAFGAPIDEELLAEAVKTVFDFTPDGMMETLGLRRPIYAATAAYGHFGRNDQSFPWEKTDKVDALKAFCGR